MLQKETRKLNDARYRLSKKTSHALSPAWIGGSWNYWISNCIINGLLVSVGFANLQGMPLIIPWEQLWLYLAFIVLIAIGAGSIPAYVASRIPQQKHWGMLDEEKRILPRVSLQKPILWDLGASQTVQRGQSNEVDALHGVNLDCQSRDMDGDHGSHRDGGKTTLWTWSVTLTNVPQVKS